MTPQSNEHLRVPQLCHLGREVNTTSDLVLEMGRRKQAVWTSFRSTKEVEKKAKNAIASVPLFRSSVLTAPTCSSEIPATKFNKYPVTKKGNRGDYAWNNTIHVRKRKLWNSGSPMIIVARFRSLEMV